jgi:hypothetical protein
LRFAVVRRVYIFGTLGYEDISYPNSLPPFKVKGGVWAAGIILTPAPDSAITVGYGHAYGVDSPILRATVGLTARTHLAVSYANFIGTSLQTLQSALAVSTVDAAGNPINSQTGAPVLLSNQLLSQQSSLMRNSVLSASLITAWPRDTLSVSFLHEQQKLLANAPGTSGFSQISWSGNVGWTHALTPVLTAASYLEIGSTNSQGVGSGWTPTLAGQFSLSYQLSPTLFGSAVYQITNQWPNVGGTILQNSLIVALHKTF